MAEGLDDADRARGQRMGMTPLSDEDGLALLDTASAAADPLLVPVGVDMTALRALATAGVLPAMLEGLVRAPARETSGGPQGSLAQRLAGAPESEWEPIVVDLVMSHVASVLGHGSAEAIDSQREFKELGFDSLAAVELRNRLAKATGLRIQPTAAFDLPTPHALATHLAERVREESPEAGVEGRPAEPSSTDGTLAALLRGAHEQGSLAEFVPMVKAASKFAPAFRSAADLERLPSLVSLARGEGTQLICVPTFLAGSGSHQFARLAKCLDGVRAVSAYSLPGFRPGEPVPGSWNALIEALAESLREAAGGDPFVLAGYSHGGAPAHALARLLEDQGVFPAGLVMIDTYAPESQDEIDQLFANVMGTILEKGHELVQESVDDDNLLAMGAYFRVGAEWEPAPIEAPRLLVRASQKLGDAFEAGRLPSWQMPPDVVEVTGDHFGLVDESAGETAQVIDAWVREHTGEARSTRDAQAAEAR
jgi:thioesterase domain-containing protein/acyl carrier protein